MFNTLPNNDIKVHIEDSTCECKPEIIFESGEMIIVHNSFDGREHREKLLNKIYNQPNKN